MRRGFRGWSVEYADGTKINEDQEDWKNIPKVGIKNVTLHYDGRSWSLDNKVVYFQKKRASVMPNIPNSFKIEERTIGYYEDYNKVMYTVNEDTGKMTIKVEEIK